MTWRGFVFVPDRVATEFCGPRKLLSSGDNALAMRMELAKHVQEIVISQENGGAIKYKGEWDLLGDSAQLRVCRGRESLLIDAAEITVKFEGVLGKAA